MISDLGFRISDFRKTTAVLLLTAAAAVTATAQAPSTRSGQAGSQQAARDRPAPSLKCRDPEAELRTAAVGRRGITMPRTGQHDVRSGIAADPIASTGRSLARHADEGADPGRTRAR